ncbi:MAG TPA: histidine phosphatase family protein [Burkholderiales bacterium]
MQAMLRILFGAVLALAASAVRADEQLWERLRAGGLVLLMRHAETTPGTGDPPGFRLEDCATQRNLSIAGREQARAVGAALARRGVKIATVLSSPWCRARETAMLAFGRAEIWRELDSMHHDRSRREAQNEAVRRRIAAFRGPGNLAFVGHGANILSLTGIHPGMGGMVVVAPGGPEGFTIVGRVEPGDVLSDRSEAR